MPIVIVPAPYRGPTQGRGEISVEGATPRECLEAVEREYPGFRELVLDGDGAVHRFIKLFVNHEEIDPEAVDHPIDAADRLEVLAAIAGG